MADLLAKTTFQIPIRKAPRPLAVFAPDCLDLRPLADKRAEHETDSAVKGLRKHTASRTGPLASDLEPALELSESAQLATSLSDSDKRQQLSGQLVHQFNALLRENDAEPLASGLVRQVRWTGSVSGRYTTAGNAANAELAAGARASAVCLDPAFLRHVVVFTHR
jgi:hypothetical protein